MVIVLTVEESSEQTIVGIPEYVDFETNVVATIFYTLNGDTPTENSDIAIGRVYLPTNKGSVTLKAFAVSGSYSSALFEETYRVTQPDQERNRFHFSDGINILPIGVDPVDSLSEDVDGYSYQETAIPFDELEMQASINQDGSSLYFINTVDRAIRQAPGIRSNPSDVYFDPKAKFIVINGSTLEEMVAQKIKLINRPNDTFQTDLRHTSAKHLRGGGLSRYIYNPNTGIIVFYYFDSFSGRMMESMQKIEPKELNISPVGKSSGGIVFRWIVNRSTSGMF